MKEPNCLFCRIVAGEVPGNKVYEDSEILAIEDIHPQAPVHILVIPKEHFPGVAEVPPERLDLIGHLVGAAKQVALSKRLGTGYRLVFNQGPDAGQAVAHVHLHLLGGRKFSWPPG
jgi:histidine triad (HIT) family protein